MRPLRSRAVTTALLVAALLVAAAAWPPPPCVDAKIKFNRRKNGINYAFRCNWSGKGDFRKKIVTLNGFIQVCAKSTGCIHFSWKDRKGKSLGDCILKTSVTFRSKVKTSSSRNACGLFPGKQPWA